MPGIDDRLPGQTRNSLARRAARQVKVMRYVREVEVSAIALQLRRERRGLERLISDAMKRDDVTAVTALHGCLHKTRDQLLRLAQVPNAPSGGRTNGRRCQPIMDIDHTTFDLVVQDSGEESVP